MTDTEKPKKTRRKGGRTVFLDEPTQGRVETFVEHWRSTHVGFSEPQPRDILAHLICLGLTAAEREYLPPSLPGVPPSELSDEELARLIDVKGIELDDPGREAMVAALERIL